MALDSSGSFLVIRNGGRAVLSTRVGRTCRGGRSRGRRLALVLASAVVTAAVSVGSAGVAQAGRPTPPPRAQVAYSSVPGTLPANVPSWGFQATGTGEFGDEVGLEYGRGGGGGRVGLATVGVVLSSWACQEGRWNTGDCATQAGAAFTHPITLNVYAVDESGPVPAPGALLASRTEVSSIPYRPSADPANCTGVDAGKWFDPATGTCNNGIAFLLRYDFGGHIPLPDRVIWTVAFNTTSYGESPIGTGAPCFSSGPGCPYDALNAGVQTFPGTPFRGVDIDPNGAFLDSVRPASYCDNGAAGTGFLRLDTAATPCWSDNTPLAEITVVTG